MIGHDNTNIAVRVTRTSDRLPTTLDSVDVNACCAPCTSLLRRETRAGLGPGEEADGHALHVVEHLRAQVVDEALPDASREPPLGEASRASTTASAAMISERGTTTTWRSPGGDTVVDDPLEQQRRDEDDEEGVEDHEARGRRRSTPGTGGHR